MLLVPSTLYFFSRFAMACFSAQEVFPEPGRPTIMMIWKTNISMIKWTTLAQRSIAVRCKLTPCQLPTHYWICPTHFLWNHPLPLIVNTSGEASMQQSYKPSKNQTRIHRWPHTTNFSKWKLNLSTSWNLTKGKKERKGKSSRRQVNVWGMHYMQTALTSQSSLVAGGGDPRTRSSSPTVSRNT